MNPRKKGIKVLVVDDEENVREAVSYILEERGFIVEEARNGKEALKEVARSKPDIIILDVSMPEMDGIQACRRLRKNPNMRDIPIIFLSAQRDIAEAIQDIPGERIGYIEKPFDIKCLLKKADSFTAKRSSHK
jgi:CheY-like chemotaxis protein